MKISFAKIGFLQTTPLAVHKPDRTKFCLYIFVCFEQDLVLMGLYAASGKVCKNAVSAEGFCPSETNCLHIILQNLKVLQSTPSSPEPIYLEVLRLKGFDWQR